MIGFLTASLLYAITPGPGVAYIVTRTLARGRATGLASVLGIAAGNLVNGVLASVGVALVLTRWPFVFEIVKLAGAAYFVMLGVLALRVAPTAPDAPPQRPIAIVRDGFAIAVLNPKTTLFFAAFVPQFVPSASAVESAGLAAAFVVIAAATDTLYVLLATTLAPLVRSPRAGLVMRWAPALVCFALALYAALS